MCTCGQFNETPEHVLMECSRFSDGRPENIEVTSPDSCRYLERVVKELWILENGLQSVKQ